MSDPADRIDPTLAPTLPPAQPAPTLPTAEPGAPAIAPLPAPPSVLSDAPAVPNDPGVVPYLPAAKRPEPAAAAPVEFDARAMVDAQKHYTAQPAYGALPVANPESRAAAEVLRKKAHRRRQRNKMLSRGVLVVFIGGIGAAGYFGYAAYQDDQDRRAAELEAARAATDANAADGGFAGPLGEQGEITETLDELGGGASPSAGGLLDAVDQARDVVGQPDPSAPAPPAATAPPVGLTPAVIWNEIGFFSFTFRTYSGVGIDSTRQGYAYVYDTSTDTYAAVGESQDRFQNYLQTFSREWVTFSTERGRVLRAPRLEASLAEGPDFPLATLLGEGSVLPISARPLATVYDAGQVLLGPTSDAERVDVEAYLLDVAAFRAADPVGHAEWLAAWTSDGAADTTLFDTSRVENATTQVVGLGLEEFEPIGIFLAGGEPVLSDRALVVFALTADRFVRLAIIIDPVNDFRAEYILHPAVGAELRTLIDVFDDLTFVAE